MNESPALDLSSGKLVDLVQKDDARLLDEPHRLCVDRRLVHHFALLLRLDQPQRLAHAQLGQLQLLAARAAKAIRSVRVPVPARTRAIE